MEFAQLILISQMASKIHFVPNGLVVLAHNAQVEPISTSLESVLQSVTSVKLGIQNQELASAAMEDTLLLMVLAIKELLKLLLILAAVFLIQTIQSA